MGVRTLLCAHLWRNTWPPLVCDNGMIMVSDNVYVMGGGGGGGGGAHVNRLTAYSIQELIP